MPPKGRLLYENRCLVTLRVAFEGENVFFRAQCKAQMKKIVYVVTIKMDSQSTILETHCECAAGSGVEAHCKHIFTTLHGIEDMSQTKSIIMHKVCTQEIMSFKRPKKPYYESPMQSHHLPNKRRKISDTVLYNPLDESSIMDNYEDYVRNLTVAVASKVQHKIPFLQTVKPANPYAIVADHDYCISNHEDRLLESLLLKNVTLQQVEDVKNATCQQSGSKEWHQQRSVRITSSIFHAVCHSKEGTRKILAQNILCPKKFTSRATTHGKVHEAVALQKYERFLSAKIDRCGLCISETHPFLAASPDGLLQNETVIEVKCPFVPRRCPITPNTVPYLYYSNNELKLKPKHNYYTQIQGQMFCTNRKYGNLVVYTFVDMAVIYVERDEEFITDMVCKLTSFYENHLRPAVLDKHLYKNYDSIIKK